MTWFLVSDQGSLVGLCIQAYKSVCTSVTICATLVDIQTHSRTHRQHFTSLDKKLSQLSQKQQDNVMPNSTVLINLHNDQGPEYKEHKQGTAAPAAMSQPHRDN